MGLTSFNRQRREQAKLAEEGQHEEQVAQTEDKKTIRTTRRTKPAIDTITQDETVTSETSQEE